MEKEGHSLVVQQGFGAVVDAVTAQGECSDS